MVVVINAKRGVLQGIPKELRINSEDTETLVISKIFLVEDALLRSLIRIVSRTTDTITYEVGEVSPDDLLRDPYAFNSVSSEKFKTYFKSFSKFKNLKPKELLQVITVKLYSTLPDMFQDLSNEVKDFLKAVTIVKKELYSQTALVLFNLSEKTKKSLIQLEDGKYIYSLITSIADIQIAEDPIDAIAVMKEIQLSKEVPLAHVSHPITFKPLIKVWNGLPKEQLKNFLLLETKSVAGKVNIRRPRGLTFKVLSNTGEYLTVYLSKTSPKISLRCNWKTEDNAGFSDVRAYVKPANPLISQIQRIVGKSIKPIVSIKYAKVLCKIKQSGSVKNILKALNRSPSNLKLVSSTDSSVTFTIFNITADLKIIRADNSTSLLISGARQETQLFEVIDSVINLLHLTEGKTPEKPKIQTERPFAPNCPAPRKPRILRDSEVAKTYSINSPSGKLCCNDNEKYKYPGYTSKNDICCFAKDQRKKPNFKTSSVSRKIIFSDENVLAKPVILTDKLLQDGRLGVMPKIIADYFTDDFNRVGVADGTLLNAISYCLGTDFTRKKLEENFNHQLADSLDISYTSTIKYIRTEKNLSHSKLLSIAQKIISKNIVVITDTSVFCDEVVDFEFKDFIVLYTNKNKSKSNYEPLVKTIDYKTLQKIFTKKDIIEFLKIYHTSCQINFSPSLVPYSYVRLKEILSVKAQVLSENGKKCVFVVTSSGILPIVPQPSIYRLKVVSTKESTADAKTQYSLLESLNLDAYSCVGQIPNEGGKIIALLTKCKIIIPVKESQIIPKVPVLDDVEYVENLSFKSKRSEVSVDSRKLESEEYQRLRYDTQEMLKFNANIRNKLLKTKKSTNLVYAEKISVVQKLLDELKLKKNLKKLSLELLNDNEILNGDIRLNSLDSRRFVIRPTETVLATPEEIAAFFK